MWSVPLLLLAVTAAGAAPRTRDQDYVVMPQKRAALVLDRLLIALQKALHEDEGPAASFNRFPDPDGPQTAPLRFEEIDNIDMSALQRRGQSGGGRGRVLRCYFNAVTCF